jgi:hypothetical protein
MSSLNNIDKKYNIVIYASFIILAIGLIYVMNKQNNLINKQNNFSSLITTGPGSNTVKIPPTGGLYYYTPAICQLYAKSLTTDGWIQWAVFSDITTPTKGFSLADSYGPNTSIIPDITDASYEININGYVTATKTSSPSDINTAIVLTMNNINIRDYDLFRQSSIIDNLYTVNGTSIVKGTNFTFNLQNANLADGNFRVWIKFIGF